ncbi:hypothetical protein [Burkholderia arboris]|uniref:hypothetical protein n=1 Tax=Burkholderia arboris TaxID=488730 RepID=UPI001CF3CC0E|nr:hypothetical protein [Burkholderia arboris]MCA8050900.1 hypothetical protein [Burkholderia arboris]
MAKAAPIVNEKLASLFAREADPVEEFASDQRNAQYAATMSWTLGVHPTLAHGRLVALACGHFTVTKAPHRAKCKRCGEMIRAGYDYDAFRNGGAPDAFSWPSDPFLPLHEKLER